MQDGVSEGVGANLESQGLSSCGIETTRGPQAVCLLKPADGLAGAWAKNPIDRARREARGM